MIISDIDTSHQIRDGIIDRNISFLVTGSHCAPKPIYLRTPAVLILKLLVGLLNLFCFAIPNFVSNYTAMEWFNSSE